jgi:RNA polymerase sigma-70 factor (ECF subfamily)
LLVTLGPALLGAVRGVLGAHSPDVEDVLQEAMLALHRALSSFRGESKTVHFACRVAVQTAMNARRRAGYRARYTPSVSPDAFDDVPHAAASPADAQSASERREALRALLDELPLPQGEALALHVVLGYSVEETAETTGVPVNTVRSRLRNALAALRERIRDDSHLRELLGGPA